MSKEEKTFTDEQKNSITLKAVSGGDEAVKRLAEEHDISEETIRNWIRETGVSPVSEQGEEITLEVPDDFGNAVEAGITPDTINYRRLLFWAFFGIAVILIFIQSIVFLHDYSVTTTMQIQSDKSHFFEIEQLKQKDQAILNSFGVVDPDQGIYRIPIDSAITLIANE